MLYNIINCLKFYASYKCLRIERYNKNTKISATNVTPRKAYEIRVYFV